MSGGLPAIRRNIQRNIVAEHLVGPPTRPLGIVPDDLPHPYGMF